MNKLEYTFILDLIDTYMLIPGWLEKEEALLLYMLAKGKCDNGTIVELGSYQGRSTACLARGLADSGAQDKVISVDIHSGCAEHQPGASHFNPDTVDSSGRVNTLPLLKSNLEAVGLSEYVDVWCMSICDAGSRFDSNISLLFIDADHATESVKADFKAWSKYLRYGSIVAFHDFGTWEGPTTIGNELIESGLYKKLCVVRTILVLIKVA